MAAPRIHESFVVGTRPDEVRMRLIPAATTDGYTLVGELPNGFAVHRRRTPVWAIVMAVIFFPLGLVMLLAKTEEVATVAIESIHGGAQVTLSGRASGRLQTSLRTALAALPPGPAAYATPTSAASVIPPPPPPPPVPEEQVPAVESAPEPVPDVPDVPEAPLLAPPTVGLPGPPPAPTFPGGLAGGGPPGGVTWSPGAPLPPDWRDEKSPPS